MKRSYRKILRNRKRRIQRRLDSERGWSDQVEPIMRASNIHYEIAEKARAVNCGGIGAIHLMVNKLGLRQEIALSLSYASLSMRQDDLSNMARLFEHLISKAPLGRLRIVVEPICGETFCSGRDMLGVFPQQ